ncbi:hypothetical protein SEA_YEET_79 [Mycobacterium phage Yeet]|uniref:Uncharacterized protein n=1 Tax=Mycobacterium phage Thibault TaxID=1052673 RepID=G1FGD7_9CAUD|nr:hypothetical protein [Acinetobacter baumannii]YP_009018083.1 hypothetical protein CL87_gp072 [Mycobacterium phage Thibault]ATN88894.1 hypothetical protein SEA_DMPSTRDIVER_86 [Mycobacterium phage DmpstrDiver]AWH13898.1 hypothetical protein SEA_HALLEY_87 [Mycobacterium phage Halley]AXF51562.1 hypothetical protein CONSTELLA_72 [Mycobacterium phage Constella]AXQ62491.1 hypothetical protein SEA_ZELINK_84 [Mycobacterium phage Zelink]AYB69567.1 hypothetical protein SEA_KALAH2_80 [Mycobacterium ph
MKIIVEIDYDPNLSYYPDEVTTKLEALQFEVAALEEGTTDVGMFINHIKNIYVVDDDGVRVD